MSLLEYASLAFVTLLVIVDPIATAPLFLAMTPQDTREARARMARTACLTMAGTLLGFAVAGAALLGVLGISVAAFQTAGGILLLLIALDMLQGQESTRKISQEESAEGAMKADIAITPLAVPLLAGPGAITTSIVLASQAAGWGQRLSLYGIILLVSALTYWILCLANRGASWLSPLVLRVVTRLAGLILAALAVQFMFNGLLESGLFGGDGES